MFFFLKKTKSMNRNWPSEGSLSGCLIMIQVSVCREMKTIIKNRNVKDKIQRSKADNETETKKKWSLYGKA